MLRVASLEERTWPLEEKHESFSTKFMRFSNKLDSFGVELRGIHRTLPEERRKPTFKMYLQMVLLWASGCGGLSSISGTFLGPLLFGLSFKDSISSTLSGIFLGCLIAAYGATMGPRSGLRQMVGARFQFGWWPAKVLAFFNVITLLGWSVINCVFGGQILAAVSNEKVPIEVGITIITVISIVIAIFGIRYVQYAESLCAIPVNIAFVLLYVCAGSRFDTTTPSVGDSPTVIANWLSNFSSCVGITATWIAITSDYYVEFPEDVASWKIFSLTTLSIFIPTAFVGTLGVGIASAAVTDPVWGAAYESLGNGGLLNAAFSRWNGGGKFLLVVLYISLVTNNILNTYSIALSMQVWGRFFTKVPRYILAFSDAIVYFVLAMAGRNELSHILSSFLPMITYWVMIYFAILTEENLLFRRRNLPGLNDAYDWSLWNDKLRIPAWYPAAFVSYLCGIAGAVIGMYQTYYVGPIAAKLGEYGGDIGIFLAFGFTALVYPVLRALEIKISGHL